MKGVPASQLVIATTGPHQKVSLSITKPCATDHKIVLLTAICDEVAATIETGNILAIEVSPLEDGDVGMPASDMEIGSSDADGGVSQSVDLGRSNNPNTTPTKDYKKVRVVVCLHGVQRGCAEEGERGSTPTG